MTTILDALQKGTGYLEKHGVENARLNMQQLLAHVVKCDRMELYVNFDRALSDPELEKLRTLMKERGKGRPLQHLLGIVEFHGSEFLCDDRALIPRPETEYLVDLLAKREWPAGVRVLDVGTGSGVIGLSLAIALARSKPQVILGDVSRDALTLAKENADRLAEALNQAELRFVESDLFSAIEGQFDLITANLPYVSEADMATLSREVGNDPHLALQGGRTGTEIMETFLGQVGPHLANSGLFAMEFGMDQEDALEAAARSNGFTKIDVVKDLESRPRFLLVGR